ncbi:MAG: hypothetical protein ACNS63_04245 [Candidatus Nitrospinota bacterium M3_3B_026]
MGQGDKSSKGRLTALEALSALDGLRRGRRVTLVAVTRYHGVVAEPVVYEGRSGPVARFLMDGDTYLDVPVEDIGSLVPKPAGGGGRRG